MEKEEFITKAKEFGYTDEMIEEVLQNQEEGKISGIYLPLECYLEKIPTSRS